MKMLLLFLLFQVSQHALCVLEVEEKQSVVLPCQVSGKVDQESTVEWKNDKFNPQTVFAWRQGKELTDAQNPHYRGRTKLQDNFQETGKLDLTLDNANFCDSGSYVCSVRRAGQQLHEQRVQLQVTGERCGLTSGEVAGIVFGVIAALIGGLFIGFITGRRWKPAK